jgi:hypothetical protein
LVDEKLMAGMALEVLEEKSNTPTLPKTGQGWGTRARPYMAFAHTISYFGNFKDGINFGADTLQFAGAVERSNPLTQVFVGHEFPLQ